jgi:hypothetical protein
MALLLLGALGLSQLLQARMARQLVDKVLESQKIKIRDRVRGFDATLHRAETSASRYANLVSYRSADLASEPGSFEAIAQRDPDGSWRISSPNGISTVTACWAGRPCCAGPIPIGVRCRLAASFPWRKTPA